MQMSKLARAHFVCLPTASLPGLKNSSLGASWTGLSRESVSSGSGSNTSTLFYPRQGAHTALKTCYFSFLAPAMLLDFPGEGEGTVWGAIENRRAIYPLLQGAWKEMEAAVVLQLLHPNIGVLMTHCRVAERLTLNSFVTCVYFLGQKLIDIKWKMSSV